MLVLSAVFSLLIKSGCVICAALYLILYIGGQKKEYLYIALLMLSQYLIELIVRGYEISSPIYYYFHNFLSVPVVIKSLLYFACAFLICHLFKGAVGGSKTWILTLVEAPLFIWLVMFPLLKVRTGFLYICYLLPFQLLVIVLAFIGSRSFGKTVHKSMFLRLDMFLRLVGILGLMTVFEDIFAGLHYGLNNDVASLVTSGAIRSRNIGESVSQIVVAAYLIVVAARFFVDKITVKPISYKALTGELSEEANRRLCDIYWP